MPHQRTFGLAFATVGVPLTVGGLGWLAHTAGKRSRLVPVHATVVRVYQAPRYTGYSDGAFTPHPGNHVEVVYNHPSDGPDATMRTHHLPVYRKHRPNSRLRLLVDPDDPDAQPHAYGMAGYTRPARFSAVAGPVALTGVSLLLVR